MNRIGNTGFLTVIGEFCRQMLCEINAFVFYHCFSAKRSKVNMKKGNTQTTHRQKLLEIRLQPGGGSSCL